MDGGIDLAIFNENFDSVLILNSPLVNSLLPNDQANEVLGDLELKLFWLELRFFLLNSLLNWPELRDIFIIEFDNFRDLFDIRSESSNVNEIGILPDSRLMKWNQVHFLQERKEVWLIVEVWFHRVVFQEIRLIKLVRDFDFFDQEVIVGWAYSGSPRSYALSRQYYILLVDSLYHVQFAPHYADDCAYPAFLSVLTHHLCLNSISLLVLTLQALSLLSPS